ncbi:hypothetical protein E2C01_092908 [Portunus trituberculatus]|uniref:Uncharacterized protein n=1 Tax=Portunus trituberculatus TaxID=210409 RepID=A0A5B7JX72_PORTR|nr:hypothetical protein [Portunus trituberculatus]
MQNLTDTIATTITTETTTTITTETTNTTTITTNTTIQITFTTTLPNNKPEQNAIRQTNIPNTQATLVRNSLLLPSLPVQHHPVFTPPLLLPLPTPQPNQSRCRTTSASRDSGTVHPTPSLPSSNAPQSDISDTKHQ